MDIKITGLHCVHHPKPNKGGDTILAYFDCKVDWLTMYGAALVRQATNDRLTLWEPLGKDDKPYRRCMQLDGPARWEVAEAAMDVFERFS